MKHAALSKTTAQEQGTPNRVAQRNVFVDNSAAAIAQRQRMERLASSPQTTAQRERINTLQRVEEEEPLQGKFATAQRVEEEEPLQGKFETAQRVEEEELLQGKFETAQRVKEDEDLLQGKFETTQRVKEDEDLLQGKFETVAPAQRVEASGSVPNNTGLPSQLKAGMESLSGMSLDHVKVHYNSSKPAQLNAHAYAQGSDIHVAAGQEQHLPHEAWHVVQQAQGRVKPTMQMKGGTPVNDDVGLETEADVMGSKAMAVGQRHAVQRRSLTSMGFKENAIQRMIRSAYSPVSSSAVFQRRETTIGDSARNHYADGWGDLYNIVQDSQLLARVGGDDSDPDRVWRINLGDFYHEEEDKTRNCKIAGEDWTKTVGKKSYAKTKIFHCGPSSQ